VLWLWVFGRLGEVNRGSCCDVPEFFVEQDIMEYKASKYESQKKSCNSDKLKMVIFENKWDRGMT